MFDLKYYNDKKKQEIWIDELKSKHQTRQYIASIRKDKHILIGEISKLPDFVDFKATVDILHSKFGQKGLVEYKKFSEIQ
jgi:hypothetical protein